MSSLLPPPSSSSSLRRVCFPPSSSAPATLPRSGATGGDFCAQPLCLLTPHPRTGFRQPIHTSSSSSSAPAASNSSNNNTAKNQVSSTSSSLAGSKAGSPFSGGESSGMLSTLNDSLSSLSLTSLAPSGIVVGARPRHHQALYNGVGHARTNLTKKLTFFLLETIRTVDPKFEFNQEVIPRRILTKPSEPALNNGHDNLESDFILIVNDILGDEEGHRYQILELLGHGTFGQVVRCRNVTTGQMVAVKVIKNKPAYFKQSLFEVNVLELLNHGDSQSSTSPYIIKLVDHFIYAKHLCMAFELLGINLYELLKFNQFRGLSLSLVRIFAAQILEALVVLHDSGVIHCDLKPENILLRDLDSTSIKVIDFGSACMEKNTLYTYIQSRFYRSPEVLLGLPYSSAIDMWSLGCICAELFLGLPLFPGSSEYNQLSRIVEMRGEFPSFMVESGKHGYKYFQKLPYARGYTLKGLDQFSREYGVTEKPSKRYFEGTNLEALVQNYPCRKTGEEYLRELDRRDVFYDFLKGILCVDPHHRWTPRQAQCHPFLRGERSMGSFKTPPDAMSKNYLHELLAAKQFPQSSHSHSQTQPPPQSHIHSSSSSQSQSQQYQPQPQQYQSQQQQQTIFGFQVTSQQDSAFKVPASSMSGIQSEQRMSSQQPPIGTGSSSMSVGLNQGGIATQKTIGFAYGNQAPPSSLLSASTSGNLSTSQGFSATLPPFLATSAYGQSGQGQGSASLGHSSSGSLSANGMNVSPGSLSFGKSSSHYQQQQGPPSTSSSSSNSSFSVGMAQKSLVVTTVAANSAPVDNSAPPPGLGSFVLGTSPSGHSYFPGTSPSYNSFSGWQPTQFYLPYQQPKTQNPPAAQPFQPPPAMVDFSATQQLEAATTQRMLGTQPLGQWESNFVYEDDTSTSSVDLPDLGAKPNNAAPYTHRRLSSWGSSSSEDNLSLFSVPNDQSSLISSSSSELSMPIDGFPEDIPFPPQHQKLLDEYYEFQRTKQSNQIPPQPHMNSYQPQQQPPQPQQQANGLNTGGTKSRGGGSSSGGNSQRGARAPRPKPSPSSGNQDNHRRQTSGASGTMGTSGNGNGSGGAPLTHYRPPPPPQHNNHRRQSSGGRGSGSGNGGGGTASPNVRNRPPPQSGNNQQMSGNNQQPMMTGNQQPMMSANQQMTAAAAGTIPMGSMGNAISLAYK